MKKLAALALLLVATSTMAGTTLLTCTVSKMINENVLEESFSKEEYPDVDVTKEASGIVIGIGANSFENDGEFVTSLLKTASGGYVFQAKNKQGNYAYYVTGNKSSKKAKVIFKDLDSQQTNVLADIVCK